MPHENRFVRICGHYGHGSSVCAGPRVSRWRGLKQLAGYTDDASLRPSAAELLSHDRAPPLAVGSDCLERVTADIAFDAGLLTTKTFSVLSVRADLPTDRSSSLSFQARAASSAIDMTTITESVDCITIDDLSNLVGELRMIARRLLSTESGPCSLTPTGLAMTALRRTKLEEQNWENVRWENRAHFFSAISRAMRHALIDHARRRKARGRDRVHFLPPDEVLFQDLASEANDFPDRILALEEALAQLDNSNKRLAEVIQQFYFLGYSTVEIARFSQVSKKTIDRELKRARVILRKLMENARAVR